MPVIDVMAGAFLGQVLQVLHDTIKKAKDRSSTIRCILDRLDATIFRITPLVVKVDKLMSEEVEDSQKKVIEALKHALEQAGNLVEAYADLRRRNLIKKYSLITLRQIKMEESQSVNKWSLVLVMDGWCVSHGWLVKEASPMEVGERSQKWRLIMFQQFWLTHSHFTNSSSNVL